MTSNIAQALEELERGVTTLADRVGGVISHDDREAFEELKAAVHAIREAAEHEQVLLMAEGVLREGSG